MRKRRRTPVYAGRGGVRREVKSILFGGARRRRTAPLWLLLVLLAAGACAAVALASGRDAEPPDEPPPTAVARRAPPPPPDDGQAGPAGEHVPRPAVRWRASRAVGLPWSGRLARGVKLPAEGEDFFTWDPVLRRSPNRWWRRVGTDTLVRLVLRVAREHRAAHPDAPRVGVGDLSRPRGGPFGRRFGGLGHASHQNGLDVDVVYPRRDALEREPRRASQVDLRLAQDLVDRFVEAGAVAVFVGPSLRLRGPRRIVHPLVHHDDHMHVRIAAPPE